MWFSVNEMSRQDENTCPLLINLVNAGCRQAGPKILSDLFARVSGGCIDLRHGLVA